MVEDSTKKPLCTSDLPEAPKEVNKAKQYLINSLKDLQKETTIEEINDILSLTIKEDNTTKAITFLSYILTYTEDNQTNLCFKSESARGKSYIALEVAKLFPEEDVMKIGYASPTAFFHQKGVMIFDEEEDENGKRKFSHFLLDLSQKIMIFLDQPHDMLLQRLRPLLSHDEKELVSYITDRTQKYGTRTKKIIILGYPTVAFCTAKMKTNEQEATRMFMLSPEASQEKLKVSTRLVGIKEAHRTEYGKFLETHEGRTWLKQRISAIKDASIKNIDVEDEGVIWEQFKELHPFLVPRHQRDYMRLIALIKAHTLLNCWNRSKSQKDHKTIIANDIDIEAGFKLYKQICESNELGLPPEIYDIWVAVVKPLLSISELGATYQDIQRAYYDEYHRTLGSKRLREVVILQLESAGLLILDTHPEDGRKKIVKLYSPTHVSNEKQPTLLSLENDNKHYLRYYTGSGEYSLED